MPSTYQSLVINASINDIWDKLSNFHELSWANKVLPSVEKVGDKNGYEVGAKRVLNDAFHETLIKVDAENHLVEYSIDDGPSPVSKEDVSNYRGLIQLSPAQDADGTLVVWTSSWESNSEDAVDFCHGIYTALLNELAQSFE